MEPEDTLLDIGEPKAWKLDGLVRLDKELSSLATSRAKTRHGAQSLRWFFLERILEDPVPAVGTSLGDILSAAERSFGSTSEWRRQERAKALDDKDIGQLIGYETEHPVTQRQWKQRREQVFARVGLMFGPAPTPQILAARQFDIGTAPGWDFTALRAFDKHITQLARHHAATEQGAQTIRWHILNELTFATRPVALAEIEQQLEQADRSLLGDVSDEARRSRGHLEDAAIAQMLGFKTSRPIKEGYYRELRESVFTRVADGFGVVPLPELSPGSQALDIGRQGAWHKDNLALLDKELLALARRCARTEAGAQALRWFFLDQSTKESDPVELAWIEQRLKRLNTSIFELFKQSYKRGQPFLADARIARFVGLEDADAIKAGKWKRFAKRVMQRVDVDCFGAVE